jgi:predicted Zn-ribbon and HTH transcriptional regulator
MMATKRSAPVRKKSSADGAGAIARIVESIAPNLRRSPELSLIFGIAALVLAVIAIVGALRAIEWSLEVFLLVLFALAAAATLLVIRARNTSISASPPSNLLQPDPEVIERFNREIRPLLIAIRDTCHGHCSIGETQALVTKTVESVARIAMRRDELPELAIPGIPSFDPAACVHCGLCSGDDVGITRTGQCPRCKLHCALWNGYYNVTSS